MANLRTLVIGVLLFVVAAAMPSTAGGSLTSGTPRNLGTATPCGLANPARAKIAHVIWIWMENESYGSIVGSPEAPYLNALANACGIAENAQAITHPSLPNYLAATGGSTFGVSDDGEPSVHPIVATSLFSQISNAKMTWHAYAESMPINCDLVTSGTYATRHNPATYYVSLRSECARDDVPLGSMNNGAFALAARSGRLSNFSFIAPNICDDMHSCPIREGDNWLARLLPLIFRAPQYQAGSVAVFVTFDEGNADNHVPTIVAARSVPRHTVSRTLFTHYSLLRTTEQLLGLGYLGAAGHASSMRSAFHL